MSASTNLTLTNLSDNIVFTDLKVVNIRQPIPDSTPSCSSQMCIVDNHMSIVCVEDKARSKRVLEEFLSNTSRSGQRSSRLRNDQGSEYVITIGIRWTPNSRPSRCLVISSQLIYTCIVGISELNGVVERYDKSLSELANVVSSQSLGSIHTDSDQKYRTTVTYSTWNFPGRQSQKGIEARNLCGYNFIFITEAWKHSRYAQSSSGALV